MSLYVNDQDRLLQPKRSYGGGGIMSWDIKVYVIIPERIAFGKLLRY